jgi:hypothetical protein
MRGKRKPRRKRPEWRRLNTSDSKLEKRKKPIECEQSRLGQRKRPDDIKRVGSTEYSLELLAVIHSSFLGKCTRR